MQFPTGHTGRATEIAALFRETFTASEGADEGALIGALAQRLMDETPTGDLHVFAAEEDGALLGAILFTRLAYADDPRAVWLMAPVAVATKLQGQGVGQALIAHGLDRMRRAGADVAVTYGDPAYYSRTGFQPVTEAQMPAPYPLQFPEGWQAQSLTGAPLTPFKGPARCVPGFADPALW
jgi:predicted N-acetyltransferase YhbS